MNITINGTPFEVDEASTLEQALQLAGIKPKGIATALNNAVVPAVMRPKTVLADGDSITVITAFYGG
ncbi:MAG: sulfur carrier protein ThiS [Muribaculaceae bacterium]|jgi:sulfur carrier protein|nr:sulfur carrier protein ThiS [Muribaculaceae bacterium]